MKQLALTFGGAALALSLSGCWTKIGDLSVMSNRLIDDKTEYVELARYIEGKGKQKKKSTGSLENAIEDCIRQVPGGEFIKNTSIKVSGNGRRVRITGDVWGKKKEGSEVVQKENIKGYVVGDRVQAGRKMGTVISLIDSKQCLVQFDGDAVGTKIEYERLVRIDKSENNTPPVNGGTDTGSASVCRVGDMVQFTTENGKIVSGKVVSVSTDGSTVNVEYVQNNKYKTETVAVGKISKMSTN